MSVSDEHALSLMQDLPRNYLEFELQEREASTHDSLFFDFLLLYVPSQQLWSLRDGQHTILRLTARRLYFLNKRKLKVRQILRMTSLN